MRHLQGGAAALAILAGAPAGAATYSIDLITDKDGNKVGLNQGEATNAFDLSIDDQGTVAWADYYRDPPNGSFTDNRYQMRAVDTYGNREDSFDAGYQTYYSGPIRNNAGQYLVVTGQSGETVELAILEPDGVTKTVLAEWVTGTGTDDPNVLNYASLDFSRMAFNDNGDVAALVTTTDGKQQIVKFPSGGGAPVVILEEGDASGIFNFSSGGVAINNAGQVAFTGTEQGSSDPTRNSTTGAYVGDGSTLTRVIEGVGFTVFGRPAINADGDVMVSVYEHSGLNPQAGYVVQEAGEPTAAPVFVGDSNTSGGIVGSVNLNDHGQVAYEYNNRIYVDGHLIVAPGDRVDGVAGEVDTSFPHLSIDLRPSYGFNNSGQLVLGLGIDPDNPPNSGLPYDTSALVWANPEGATPETALMPFASTPDGQNDLALNIFNGLGVEAPIFVDPIVATGFTYSMDPGAPNFATLIIPDALPGGDDLFQVSFDGFLETLGVGTTFDFRDFVAGGVSAFTILGIDPAEGVDPTDPFVVGLTFVSGGFQTTLSIDAITVDTDDPGPGVVPLPPAASLLVVALGGLGALRRRAAG